MNDNQTLWPVAISMIMTFLLAATICKVSEDRIDNFQSEAVQRGAAEWTVDENGNRVFRWKDQTRKGQP